MAEERRRAREGGGDDGWTDASGGVPDEETLIDPEAVAREAARQAGSFGSPGSDAPPEGPDEEEQEEVAEFDPRFRLPFEGLLYIGALSDSFEVIGHTFTVRTLKAAEKLKVLEVAKRWEDSPLAYQMAYKAAVAAASVQLIDGAPVLAPSKIADPIEQRFAYVTETWHDLVIDLIYRKCDELEGKVRLILQEMGVAPQRRQVAEIGAED